jgi:hypothetical protein
MARCGKAEGETRVRITMPWLAVLWLWGCGATVGDPCTTAAECGLGTCLNDPATPGGYCSKACGPDAGTCPNGSTCVGDRCFLRCSGGTGCRTGYLCQAPDGGSAGSGTICIGPGG